MFSTAIDSRDISNFVGVPLLFLMIFLLLINIHTTKKMTIYIVHDMTIEHCPSNNFECWVIKVLYILRLHLLWLLLCFVLVLNFCAVCFLCGF